MKHGLLSLLVKLIVSGCIHVYDVVGKVFGSREQGGREQGDVSRGGEGGGLGAGGGGGKEGESKIL